MYGLELIPINENANTQYFNSWVNENYTVVGISHLEDLIIITFYSEPSQEIKDEISDRYNSLTHLDILSNQDIIDEIRRKEMREEYGLRAYNFAAASSRVQRLSLDPVPPHEQYRKDKQDPLNDIVVTVQKGDFKSVYEKLNEFVTNEHVTDETITTYRILVASYIVSNPIEYTDIFGLKVKGGQYPEHVGDTIDANGFIDNYN